MRRQNERLLGLLRPVVQSLGYELLGVEHITGGAGIVRLYIDSVQGVNVGDCARVSEQARPALDTAGQYGDCTLEVSSPGIDRPLFTLEQVARWIGHTVEIRLLRSLDGRRRLRGILLSVQDGSVRVDFEQRQLDIPEGQIDRMRLLASS